MAFFEGLFGRRPEEEAPSERRMNPQEELADIDSRLHYLHELRTTRQGRKDPQDNVLMEQLETRRADLLAANPGLRDDKEQEETPRE